MIAPATLTLLLASTARALIATESAGNPFAIGVVGGVLLRQPVNLAEAVATTQALQAAGWDYSVGLAQINRRNFARQGLTSTTAFESCANLGAMQRILGACFTRASRASQRAPKPASQPGQTALRDAFSCYYSGNFVTGHQHGYVNRVLAAAHKHRYADRPRASPVP
jgi:type IV secretion system protein VirB1